MAIATRRSIGILAANEVMVFSYRRQSRFAMIIVSASVGVEGRFDREENYELPITNYA